MKEKYRIDDEICAETEGIAKIVGDLFLKSTSRVTTFIVKNERILYLLNDSEIIYCRK